MEEFCRYFLEKNVFIDMDKLRTILFFETDFNSGNNHPGRDFMIFIEANSLLPLENIEF